MLSRHERQQLAEIERQCTASDPVLAELLRGGPSPPASRRGKLGAIATCVFGVLLVLLGAVTATFSLIFTGVISLAIAACLHVTSRHRAR